VTRTFADIAPTRSAHRCSTPRYGCKDGNAIEAPRSRTIDKSSLTTAEKRTPGWAAAKIASNAAINSNATGPDGNRRPRTRGRVVVPLHKNSAGTTAGNPLPGKTAQTTPAQGISASNQIGEAKNIVEDCNGKSAG
jgi:hypothetical protein